MKKIKNKFMKSNDNSHSDSTQNNLDKKNSKIKLVL